MLIRILVAFFFFGPLFAAKKESRAINFGIGYRRDHISFCTSQDGVQAYKENDRALQGETLVAGITSRMKNVVFELEGDVGNYLSGHSSTNFGSQSAKGLFGDGALRLGYDLVLASDAKSACRITPRAGYSAMYQELKYSGAGSSLNLTQTRLKRL